MSAIFGRWSFEGEPADAAYLRRVQSILAPYAPDDADVYLEAGVAILHHAFHTTRESRLTRQALLTKSGCVIAWDGRLDNRDELVGELGEPVLHERSDVSVVAAAYDKWNAECLAKFAGDWALCIWDSNDRSLLLARDPIGLRHLHYTFETNRITWSTLLDPLVLFAERSFTLNEEYMAGWLSSFPAARLTPYNGIDSVPPGSFLSLKRQTPRIIEYWNFNPRKRISYRSDAEYEEHFRTLFAQAVHRRLRSETPVLAELSGGMDSSAIVCVADALLGRRSTDAPRIDTISYYDDSEPNWDETDYFTKIEDTRHRRGHHINTRGNATFLPEYESGRFASMPTTGLKPTSATLEFADALKSNGNRVVLSGLGGDEVLGGVPTPIPELSDLLIQLKWSEFAQQLQRWALAKRIPILSLLRNTLCAFVPVNKFRLPEDMRSPIWLDRAFQRRYPAALTGYQFRLKVFGPFPTFQENVATLDGLRRLLGCSAPAADPPYERRYPYLDRDLLEFLFAVPREQMLRPGERRSLMRRALAGIVPAEILARKRKAFVSRGPRLALSKELDVLLRMTGHMIISSLGIVQPELFCEALRNARHDSQAQITPLRRAIALEKWLEHLALWNQVQLNNSTANPVNSLPRSQGTPFSTPNFLSAGSHTNTGRR
jgi:asparagine synthase (glutamine-hydrolysing)